MLKKTQVVATANKGNKAKIFLMLWILKVIATEQNRSFKC